MMVNRYIPHYSDDSDYNTNAPSYYEDLARKQKLIKLLSERIWKYEEILELSLEEIENVLDKLNNKIGEGFNKEIYDLLILWVEDGTLDTIINETLMNKKADVSYVDDLADVINNEIEEVITQLNTTADVINNEIEEVTTHLNTTTDHINSVSINAKYPPENYEGIVADGLTDDTVALQALLDNFNYIELPVGTILVSNTLKMRGNTHLKGAFDQTIITSNEVNLTILMGDSNVDDTTSFKHSSIKNLYIDGFNRAGGQTGLQVRGYHSKLENVYIRKTDTPFKVGGVVVDFENMFIYGNGNSGLITSPPTNFNTMLTFKRCDFHSNHGPLKDETPSNTVGLHFDYCIFENNSSRPFDLTPFTGSLNQCWIERNDEKPLLGNYRILMIKNRYETTPDYPSQTPEWRKGSYAGAWQTSGRVEIGHTHLSTRELKFQSYGPWGVPETETILKVARSSGGRHLVHEVPDLDIIEYPITSSNSSNRKLVSILINPDGSVVRNDFKDREITVEKTRTGEYRIDFNGTLPTDTLPVIQVMNPKTTGNPNGTSDTFYHTVFFRSTAGVFPRFNEINVKIFRRYQPEETTDELSDGYINLMLYVDNV